MIRVKISEIDQDGRERQLSECILDPDLSRGLGRAMYRVRMRDSGKRAGRGVSTCVRGVDITRLGPWDVLFRALAILVGSRSPEIIRELALSAGLHVMKTSRAPVRRLLSQRQDYAAIVISACGMHMLPLLNEALQTELLRPRPRYYITNALRAQIGRLEMEQKGVAHAAANLASAA